jgi:hypothetical protein
MRMDPETQKRFEEFDERLRQAEKRILATGESRRENRHSFAGGYTSESGRAHGIACTLLWQPATACRTDGRIYKTAYRISKKDRSNCGSFGRDGSDVHRFHEEGRERIKVLITAPRKLGSGFRLRHRGDSRLHLARQVWHDAQRALNQHQLCAVVHFVLFDPEDHLEAGLTRGRHPGRH